MMMTKEESRRNLILNKLMAITQFQDKKELVEMTCTELEGLYLSQLFAASSHPHSGQKSIRLIGKK
ncbi:hypothetical protein LCM00_02980 [Bacillus infantis]|uniref:hypothetical protein n=1 Tax=Bacillus infantis TaxID=324767 RepID=UPI001CD7561D|nr:hypothetical protein [Bacillus infantis]MCA1038463.1 hypothetical protein [Bacillus infantis]